jgi:putative ABC transport system permease protein
VLASLDPDLAPTEITMTEQLATEFADPRRWTVVVGAFAAVGLVLASLGIFGLMSYLVRQRRRELGVRLALGAPPASLTGLVVRTGLRHALVGVSLGVVISLLMTRWLEALLFGVRASDPLTLVGAAVMILVLAAVACWLPGVRAARIRPLEAMLS